MNRDRNGRYWVGNNRETDGEFENQQGNQSENDRTRRVNNVRVSEFKDRMHLPKLEVTICSYEHPRKFIKFRENFEGKVEESSRIIFVKGK